VTTSGETVRVALAALRENKLRATLTTLGIVIGVGAVIAMMALGSGAQRAVQEQVASLGTNLLSVVPGQSFQMGVASQTRVSLTVDDYEALAAAAGGALAAVVPEIGQSRQVQYQARNINVTVLGTTVDYPTVNNFTLTAGAMFTADDDAARRRVAVLGAAVPTLLGANGPAMIGQRLVIGGSTFEIVGLLAAKGATTGPMNQDEQILIPLATGRYRLFGADRLRSLTVAIPSQDSALSAMITIEGVLRQRHHLRSDQDNDFQIVDRAVFLGVLQSATKTLTFLLGGIAGISLVVGGIGIMNIMLVSVTERTREIGLRMAVGATRRNILQQFLVEAVVLCLAGGAIGIVVGAGAAVALSLIARWNVLLSPGAVALAWTFSAAVGLTFGLWPARRASRMDPVTALRYE
jgi:putative ABC transport system permease protein